MIYPAHITKTEKEIRIQSVEEHCTKTAEYARECLKDIGLAETAYLAGVIHDFGKYTCKYKRYIEDASEGKAVRRGSVNHTFAAVIYLFDTLGGKTGSKWSKLTCEIIAYGTGAHHGLFDAVDAEGESGFSYRLAKDRDEICYEEAKKNYLEHCIGEVQLQELFDKAVDEITVFIEKVRECVRPEPKEDPVSATENVFFLTGLLCRLVLSAVIQGDRRDTAEFFDGKKFVANRADRNFWDRQLVYFQKENKKFQTDTPINRARMYISDVCGEFASGKGGLYKITVPAGGGKTLSMLRFALTQAKQHNKKRVLFLIPLLSVLDQNSRVIRDYIEAENMVLEHHSNVVHSQEDGEELDRYELLSETWDAPIIISTLVQLLNILFSSKPSAVRRMQSLCDSVIVVDEVQSVPKRLTYLFNMAINFLVSCANATVVLSSATQPAFHLVKKNMKFSANSEILPYSSELWHMFERTQIVRNKEAVFDREEELAEYALQFFRDKKSLLIICNTKKNAARVYGCIRGGADAEVFHLSTAMCMAHRQKVLESVIQCLAGQRRVICVSTQLVEAGIDFSFESVIRVEAGLDNIAQAAGRCNRNGEYGRKGIVEVVRLNNEKLSMLREIETSQNCFRRFLADFEQDEQKYENNLLSPQSVERYSELVFHELESELSYPVKAGIQNVSMYDLLAQNNGFGQKHKNYCINQAFKTAGELFKVFDEDTFDIIVPYDEAAVKIINAINTCGPYDFGELKKLTEEAKPYMVHVYGYQMEILESSGMISCDKSGRIRMLNKIAYLPDQGLADNMGSMNLIL